MNSSLNPSSKPSNPASEQAQNSEPISEVSTETTSDETSSYRQQPIPPPSEPMQYRAIGLVRGCYNANTEQFTQGTLVATDETELNAVLLGRVISLVKNHLDLKQEHLWVVYPRTGQQDGNLHLQIVGVWEPDKLSKELPASITVPEESSQLHTQGQAHAEDLEDPSPEIEDGYFSVRGEVVYQSASDKHFIVKIKQAPRQEFDKPKFFKLKLQGILATKAVGQFWDLRVQRQAQALVLEEGKVIAVLPSKPKLRKNKPPQDGYSGAKRNLDTPRPVRKVGESTPVARPVPKTPTPKPIKRQKPTQ